jgi:hypothetical protein
MADLEWDDEVSEDVFVNPSQAILDLPSWDNVDVVNQTVLPTGTDVMGNENYPQNIDSTDFSSIPQMGGGIAGGLYGSIQGAKAPVLPQLKPITALVAGMGGAFVGGGTGDAAKQGFYTLIDDPRKPDNWKQAINSAVGAGAEEALYEGLGQTIFGLARKGYRLMRGKPQYNADVIQDTTKTGAARYRPSDGSALNANEELVPMTVMINDLITASGGRLTAAQVTNSAFIHGIEGLSGAAWGGGAIREANQLTDEAITKYVHDYIQHFNNGIRTLDSKALGELYKNMIEVGQVRHTTMGEALFNKLDDLYVETTKPVTRTTVKESPIVGADGSMLNSVTRTTTEEIVNPVNVKKLKAYVKNRIEKGKPLMGIPNGKWGGGLLKKLEQMDDKLSFESAQELRSFFLAESRSLEQKFGEGKVKLMMSKMERMLATALDEGAEKTGNDAFIAQYKLANKFWKEGAQGIKNKSIANLLKQDPEKLGRMIFADGNVTLIKETRESLNLAAKYAKGTPEAFDPDVVFRQMQSGYLESVLAKSTQDAKTILREGATRAGQKDIVANEFKMSNLNALFTKGTPLNDTFKTAFTKKQQQSIKQFTNVLNAAQKRPAAAGDFMVKVGQAGLILDTFGFVDVIPGLHSDQTTGEKAWDIGKYTVTPYLIAKLMTNPRAVRTLTRAMTMNTKSQQAGGVMAQLMFHIGEIYDMNPIEFQKQEGGQ